jgi:drug/metabolite transporter (DMT)-like permease
LPIASSILGYFVFREVPAPAVLAGAAVLLAGVAISAAGQRQT